MNMKILPVGVDDFADFKNMGYYYVDKTGMIRELLHNTGKVNLFTRPRRFGKSLNMSMLRHFFEIGTDPSLFDGLEICCQTQLCEAFLGQYPVLSLTFKQVRGSNFDAACLQMWTALQTELDRLTDRMELDRLDEVQQKVVWDFRSHTANLESALLQMCRLLYKYYHQKVIVLIDEYDVPLQNAERNGYYPQMVELLSQMFGYGMKSNEYLQFAVITGCLRVAKESIFTGFNNPKMHTIVDEPFDEWFGFTDAEVHQMLSDYELDAYYDMTKEWYDGYHFGNTHVYCPWDVVNWCDHLLHSSNCRPQNFWSNTSGNELIRRFADRADAQTREELSTLIGGGTVRKQLQLDMTYQDLDSSIDNLWGIFLNTGYLTYRDVDDEGYYELVIPNREISSLFRQRVNEWFKDKVMGDDIGMAEFYEAFDAGNADGLEACLLSYMNESISYMDGGRTDDRESFYHGLLLGMLARRGGWEVKSNRESGRGRSDITAYHFKTKRAYVVELKYSSCEADLKEDARKALEQITRMEYDAYFRPREPAKTVHFGIAFCKKECRVLEEEL